MDYNNLKNGKECSIMLKSQKSGGQFPASLGMGLDSTFTKQSLKFNSIKTESEKAQTPQESQQITITLTEGAW